MAVTTESVQCVRFELGTAHCCGPHVVKRLMSWIPPLEGV